MRFVGQGEGGALGVGQGSALGVGQGSALGVGQGSQAGSRNALHRLASVPTDSRSQQGAS